MVLSDIFDDFNRQNFQYNLVAVCILVSLLDGVIIVGIIVSTHAATYWFFVVVTLP